MKFKLVFVNGEQMIVEDSGAILLAKSRGDNSYPTKATGGSLFQNKFNAYVDLTKVMYIAEVV